jgi:hypothetical protein
VTIDIKPGDSPTTIEPERQGVIPVAILTTPTFDAALVDISTVAIGPTGTEAEVFRAMFDDVDRDGDTDRLLLFRQQEMGISCTDKVIVLKGPKRRMAGPSKGRRPSSWSARPSNSSTVQENRRCRRGTLVM